MEDHGYLVWHHFLDDMEIYLLRDSVTRNKDNFVDASVSPSRQSFRRARVLWSFYYIDFYHKFIRRLKSTEQLLRINFNNFPLRTDYELQITTSGDGDFFKRHQDNSSDNTNLREISFVYYFNMHDQDTFTGGNLILETDTTKEIIEPIHNSLLVFPSRFWHEIEPVNVPSQKFENGRFTANGWASRKLQSGVT